jgi:hypothetical protein
MKSSADLTDVHPSLHITALPEYPSSIKQALSQLEDGQASDYSLYRAAEEIAFWVEDKDMLQEHSLALLAMTLSLPSASLRTLLSALSDVEVRIQNDTLINRIAELVCVADKRLAQTAALCLIGCCGESGREVVERILALNPPNATLLAGLIQLTR